MSQKRRWFEFPQTYFAIARHFAMYAEPVEVHGLKMWEARNLRSDYRKFVRALAEAQEEEAKWHYQLARDLTLSISPYNAQEDELVVFSFRCNTITLAMRQPEVRGADPEPEPVPADNDAPAYTEDQLLERLKKRQGKDNG